MTDITPESAARREASRVHGRFGAQDHTDPEIIIYEPGSIDPQVADVLERKAESTRAAFAPRSPGESVLAGELSPGDEVLTETNMTGGPFSFAIRNDRDVRRRWRDAGMPWKLAVTGTRRAPEDGDTDDELTFDLNGAPLVLTFHRDRHFTIAH